MRLRTHRCTAEPVEPRLGGDTSRIMMAAGARHISLSAKPCTSTLAGSMRSMAEACSKRDNSKQHGQYAGQEARTTSSAARDCWYSGASTLYTSAGVAAIVAPAA